jgi:hypothetical protein
MSEGSLSGADAISSGCVANLDQLASATLSSVIGGPAHGCRALDLRVAGGIDVRILPDRGFDIGAAWYRGLPLGWISVAGENGPLNSLAGNDWLSAWGGGLLTTCGLRNVGPASEGHPLHGRFSHQRAANVNVVRQVEEEQIVLSASATIDETSSLGPHLRVVRSIRVQTGLGVADITDITTNVGDVDEPAPLLYHVNLGFPILNPDARVQIDSLKVTPRDEKSAAQLDRWAAPGRPIEGSDSLAFEHLVAVDELGWSHARLINESQNIELEVSWEAANLPRLHQWVHRRAGIYVVAIEPANCTSLGRTADRESGQMAVLEAHGERTTRVRIRVRET